MRTSRAAIAIALFALLYTAGGLPPGRVAVPLDLLSDLRAWKPDPAERRSVSNRLLSDVVTQFVPWDAFARRRLAAGRVPWVNPHAGAGEPFLANPQTALLSPFTWPRLALGERGWGITLLAKLVVAGLGARLLAIEMGASPSAALVSGLVYAGSGLTVVWAHYPITNVTALLPLLAATLLRALARPARGRLLALTCAAAAAAAGGQPEVLAVGVAGVAAFAAWEVAAMPAPRPRMLRASSAAAIGFLLLSPLLLPFLARLPESRAAETRSGAPAGGFRWSAAAAEALPGFLGSPLGGEVDLTAAGSRTENFAERAAGFVGFVALVACAISFRRLPPAFRRGLVVGAVALLVAWRVPPFGWVARIPPLSLVSAPRLAAVFVLFASAASGPALTSFAGPARGRDAGSRIRRFGVALACAGVLLVVAGALPSLPFARPALTAAARRGIDTLRRRGALPLGADVYEARLAGYLDRGRFTAARRLALPGAAWVCAGVALASASAPRFLLPAAALVELASFGIGYLPSVPRRDVPGPSLLATDLAHLDPRGEFLFAASADVYPPDLATRDGLFDVRSYDAIGDRGRADRLAALGYNEGSFSFDPPWDEARLRGLAREGVRFLATCDPPSFTPRVGGLPPPGAGIYELPGAAPASYRPDRPPPLFTAGLAVSAVALVSGLALLAGAER